MALISLEHMMSCKCAQPLLLYLFFTLKSACNYDSTVNTDNGSCNYALEFYDCNNQCINDIDNDLVCDELEIGGCMDTEATLVFIYTYLSLHLLMLNYTYG